MELTQAYNILKEDYDKTMQRTNYEEDFAEFLEAQSVLLEFVSKTLKSQVSAKKEKKKQMTKQRAIEIMQTHIETLKYQLTDKAQKEMISAKLIEDTVEERERLKAYILEQTEAYQLAITALKESE